MFSCFQDIFIVCFSLVDKKTLKQVKTKWLPEIRDPAHGCQDASIILVGTKLDLLEDQSYLRNLAEAKARGETMDEAVKSGDVSPDIEIQAAIWSH